MVSLAVVPMPRKPQFSAGFGPCFGKKTENFKSVLTESKAAHRSHSTDAVSHTVRFDGHQKPGARVALQKEGKPRRRSFALFDIVILMKGHVGGGPGSSSF